MLRLFEPFLTAKVTERSPLQVILFGAENRFVSVVYFLIYVDVLAVSLWAMAKANSIMRTGVREIQTLFNPNFLKKGDFPFPNTLTPSLQKFIFYKGVLYKLIPCCCIAQKLKLQLFFDIDQKNDLISYKHHYLFYYSNFFLCRFLCESGTAVILLYKLLN